MKRAGRPSNGNIESGREYLLARTRDALRKRPKIDMQRGVLAEIADITPALISYYYPDKWNLFADAARPVVQTYILDTRKILECDDTPLSKLCLLIGLYLKFNYQHGFLLDFYLENVRLIARREDLEELQVIYAEILSFFTTLISEGIVRGSNPAFVQSSIWGACNYLVQKHEVSTSEDEMLMLEEITENIIRLFLTNPEQS